MIENSDKKDTEEEKIEEKIELKSDLETSENTNKENKAKMTRNNSFYEDRCEQTHWKMNPFKNTTPTPTPSPTHFYSTRGGEITDIPSSDSE